MNLASLQNMISEYGLNAFANSFAVRNSFLKRQTNRSSISICLLFFFALTLSAHQAACAQASMSEGEMQQMLNQMNSWQSPQGGGGGGGGGGMGGGNMGGGNMGGMQRPMMQPNQFQHLQQELNQMPMQQMQQMPMQQMQQMPMQHMQQMPMQQMQQMPMQQMQQMPMQHMRPMQMLQQMSHGSPLEAGMGSGVQNGASVGDNMNMSNLMGRKLIGNGGIGGGGGMGFLQRLNQMNNASGGGGGGGGHNPNSQSAKDAIQYQLGVARSMASQAVNYSYRARSGNDKSAKQSAASEARYYATQARVAAERAEARVWECPEASGMASSARGESNRAQSAANYASDAASGW